MSCCIRIALIAFTLVAPSIACAQPTPQKLTYASKDVQRFPWKLTLEGNSYESCKFQCEAVREVDQSSAESAAKAFISAFDNNPELGEFLQALMMRSWEWVLSETEPEIKEAFTESLAATIIEGNQSKLKEMRAQFDTAMAAEYPQIQVFPVSVKCTEVLPDNRIRLLLLRPRRELADATTSKELGNAYVVTCIKVGEVWSIDDCKVVDSEFDAANATTMPPEAQVRSDITIKRLAGTDEWEIPSIDSGKPSKVARAPIGELMQHCYGRQYNIGARAFRELFTVSKGLFSEGYIKRAPEINPWAERKETPAAVSKYLQSARSTTSETTGSYEFTYELKHDGTTVIDAEIKLEKVGDRWVVTSARFLKTGEKALSPINSLFDVIR